MSTLKYDKTTGKVKVKTVNKNSEKFLSNKQNRRNVEKFFTSPEPMPWDM